MFLEDISTPDVKYRREIDGMRALSILPVIFYHSGVGVVPGGFVGVDVFFVISGYLITSIIITAMAEEKFSLLSFYERRARRILPALFLVALLCLPFAYLWLAPDNFKEFARSVLSLSVFGSNFFFGHLAGSYFGTDAELKPLLHTWSLGVEEQFYLTFPLTLMVIWRLRRDRVLLVLAAIAIVSLGLAQWSLASYPAVAFYWPQSRCWELLAGAIPAVAFDAYPQLLSQFRRRRAVTETLAGTGLLLLAWSAFFFGPETPFPGLHAIVPVAGALLVIVFADQFTIIGRFLGTPVMVGIGLISYSAYLWHLPLMAFARLRWNLGSDAAPMMALAAASFVLAWGSWRFVERPFRTAGRISRRTLVSSAVIAGAAMMAFGAYFGTHDRPDYARGSIPKGFAESIAYPRLQSRCQRTDEPRIGDAEFCIVGEIGSARKIAVFGDSHSEVLLPVLDEAAKRLGREIVHIVSGGCPGFLGTYVRRNEGDTGYCAELAAAGLAFVKKHHIEAVVLASRWTMYTDGDYSGKRIYYLSRDSNVKKDLQESRLAFVAGLSATVNRYREIGAKVVVIEQVPLQVLSPQTIYYQLFYSQATPEQIDLAINRLSVKTATHERLQAFTRGVFEKAEKSGAITTVNFDRTLCGPDVCAVGTRTETRYFDSSHLSDGGARRLLDDVVRMIERL